MRWKLAAVAIVTTLCLVGVMWGIDVREASSALQRARPVALLPLVALYLSAAVLRTIRGRALLTTPVAFGAMFVAAAVGFFATNVLPLRLGELVRPFVLAERHEVPLGEALASVVAERVLDLAALLVLLTVVAVGAPVEPIRVGDVEVLSAARWVVVGTAGVALLGLALVALTGGWIGRVAATTIGRLHPRLGARMGGLITSLTDAVRLIARRPVEMLVAVLCTAGLWGTAVAAAWVALWAFPGLAPTAWDAAVCWAATVSAITAVPTPGYFGAFEAGAVASLAVLGFDADVARAFAVAYHLFAFGFTVGLGLICAWAASVDVRALIARSRAARAG